MQYFVYAIYNKVYIGQTENLDLRLKLHNDKFFKHSYTSRYDGNWNLIYQEKVVDRTEAIKREKQLKSCQGRQFIKIHSAVAQW